MTDPARPNRGPWPRSADWSPSCPAPVARATRRRAGAVASAVGSTLPVYVERAGGGVLVDVDGNSLIDLGAGIAVDHVGNAAPASSRRPAAGRPLHPHLLHGHALRGLRGGLRAAQPAHPRRPREALGAVQLGRRGGGERGQDRAACHRRDGRRRLRPRLPRPHQPHDGDDREEHALQGRLRAVRGRGLPGADVLPVPRRAGQAPERGAARAISRSTSRSAPPTSPPSSSSRSRARAASSSPPPGFLPALADWCRGERHRVRRRRDPDRLRPHRRVVRLRARGRRPRPGHHRQGHRRRAAAGRGHRSRRDHGRGPHRRPRRHLRRQPGGLRGGARRHPDHARAGPRRRRPRPSRPRCSPRLHALQERTAVIGDVRGRGAMVAVELVQPGTTSPDAALDRPRSPRPATPRASSC